MVQYIHRLTQMWYLCTLEKKTLLWALGFIYVGYIRTISQVCHSLTYWYLCSPRHQVEEHWESCQPCFMTINLLFYRFGHNPNEAQCSRRASWPVLTISMHVEWHIWRNFVNFNTYLLFWGQNTVPVWNLGFLTEHKLIYFQGAMTYSVGCMETVGYKSSSICLLPATGRTLDVLQYTACICRKKIYFWWINRI